MDNARARALFDVGRRRVVHGDRPKAIAFAQIKRAELGLAQASGIGEHRRKHRLEIAARIGNDAQHLGARRLLLQRGGKLASYQGQLLCEVCLGHLRRRSPIARFHRSNCVCGPSRDSKAA